MNEITILIETEIDDDHRIRMATASRGGVCGFGSGYSPEVASQRAIQDLTSKEKLITPASANWENTPEAALSRFPLIYGFMAEIIREVREV